MSSQVLVIADGGRISPNRNRKQQTRGGVFPLGCFSAVSNSNPRGTRTDHCYVGTLGGQVLKLMGDLPLTDPCTDSFVPSSVHLTWMAGAGRWMAGTIEGIQLVPWVPEEHRMQIWNHACRHLVTPPTRAHRESAIAFRSGLYGPASGLSTMAEGQVDLNRRERIMTGDFK